MCLQRGRRSFLDTNSLFSHVGDAERSGQVCVLLLISLASFSRRRSLIQRDKTVISCSGARPPLAACRTSCSEMFPLSASVRLRVPVFAL